VRCVDCQTKPDSPNQHCECCGRELARAAAAEPIAIVEMPMRADRHCRVCGVSIPEGEFCAACLGSFSAWAWAEPASAPEAATPPRTAQIDTLWSELMNTPAPPDWIDLDPRPKQVAPPPVPHAPVVPHPGENIAVSPPAIDNGGIVPRPLVSPREAVLVDTVQTGRPASPALAPVPAPAKVQAPPAMSAVKAPAVAKRPQAATPSRSRSPLMLTAAAAILAAGLGAYWLKVHGWVSLAPEQEVSVALNEPARAPQLAQRSVETARPAPSERSAQPAPQAKKRVPASSAAARQSSTVSPRTRTASAPAPVLIPAASLSLPVAAPLAEAPTPAAPAPPSAPQGPFFEPTDVNEAPRVATRVEPDVPEDLRGRARNEIVIVRMLVSQSGRPSRVSLLRRSKSGPRLDEAVIAAVNQWTFAPAKRRGEAVSCWFNMGVPVKAN
jgi:protein TonB